MKKVVMFLAACTVCATAMGQIKIKGHVLDRKDNSPMIGVTVTEKGAKNGAITDLDGNFTITVTGKNPVLQFSYIGYVPQDVKYTGQKDLRVTLSENTAQLDEFVVVGYGKMKKSDLSGSVGSLDSKDLMKGDPVDLTKGMQGKIAGVQINQNDGAPGAGVSIQVRGANSFTTSTQPLIIVDGVPFDTGGTPASDANANNNQTSNPLSFINPHDIQSIEVLKDASATAIYGSRGANGVVIITTKKGSSGDKDNVEFSASVTMSKIAKKIDMLDAYTYANYINEQTINDYLYSGNKYTYLPYPEGGMWNYPVNADNSLNYQKGTYSPSPEDFLNPGLREDQYGNQYLVDVANWQDLIYQTGYTQEYNVSVSGGSAKGWHSFSGNYLDQQGTIKNSGYTRFALRANIGRHIFDWLEMGLNTSFTHTLTDYAKTNAYDYGILRSALIFPPTYGPNTDTSTSDELNWLASNPYAYVSSAKDQLRQVNVFNSSYVEVKLFPFLKFRQNLGVSWTSGTRGTYYDRHTQEGKYPTNGKGGQSDNWWLGVTSESLLTYDETIRKIHHINALLGFTVETGTYGSKGMTATNFPDDYTLYYDMSRALNKATIQSDYGDQHLVSLLGRVNYTLKDRYLFTASFRRDGSSKFSKNHKWANFLSGAVAWRLSEEQFVKDLNVFSNLKLRLSYGETGNQAIGSYRTLSQMGSANYPFAGSLSSGVGEVDWRGPVSSDLRWETTRQFNAGIDAGVLDGRVNLTVDFYYKKTTDLLQNVQIPLSTGFSTMLVNRAYVTNKGLEITGNFVVLRDTPLKWDINANISFNKNQIGGLDGDQFAQRLFYGADNVFLQRNGCPIGTLYGYVEDGFYDNEAEVRADPQYRHAKETVVKAMVGEVKYRDLNNDGVINDKDRTIIGDTNPDYVYGITNNFAWKGFNLSFMLQGSQGNDIFNGNLLDIKLSNYGNITRDAYDHRWTPENAAQAKWPKASNGYDRTWKISNRYVEDGSYLKLKSLNFGYTFHPGKNSFFKAVSAVNVYFNATNLFTITKYSWMDPDVNAFATDASRRGVDIYSYPSARTFSLGMKLSL